jgi:hypothetical protein
VRDGRLTFAEPTDLADGTRLELVATELHVFKACMRNGRLIFDEPTNLPEGASVELVSDDTVVWWRPLDPSALRLLSNGSIDAPMELPDGSLVEFFSLDDVLATGGYFLNEEELAALDSELDRELDASFEEEASGQLIDAEDAIADLRSCKG